MPIALSSELHGPGSRHLPPPLRIEVEDPVGGVVQVRLHGALAFTDASSLWSELRSRLPPTSEEIRFDLSRIESIDGGAMALLVQDKWNLQTAGARCSFIGGAGTVQASWSWRWAASCAGHGRETGATSRRS